jgi:hypothetical protein
MIKKLFLPVKEFHRGNTAFYLERALQGQDLEGSILTESQFVHELRNADSESYFLCVDSGEIFDFNSELFEGLSLEQVGYWLIDFRHHKEGPRTPTDLELCKTLHERGGRIFQSQYEDYQFCIGQGWKQSYFLPLAADTEIWSDEPKVEKKYHLAFTGNVWDQGRAKVLETLLRLPGLKFGFPGHGGVWLEEAAAFLRHSLIGFNVNSWYGSAHDYDLNMRFFETLSCGLPLITNWVPGIDRLFPHSAPFIATYKNVAELPQLIERCLASREFLESGSLGRRWILDNATYLHRLNELRRIIS